MQIQIEVINVGAVQTVPTKNGKSYQCVEVAYKKDGKVEGKKIMSFVNTAVFKAVQELNAGDVVSVTTEKGEPNANGQSFWQWTAIGGAGEAPASAPSRAGSTAGTPQKSGSWETEEERAARQVMIVRQSSLGHAVALLGAKSKVSHVIETAKEFEAYVLGTDKPDKVVAAAKTPEVADDSFPDDIPY